MYTKPMHLNETFAMMRGVGETSEKDLIGIEIELEGKNIHPITSKNFLKYWADVPDNSLRKFKPGDQAIEYRYSEPLNLKDTERALVELEYNLSRPDVEIYDSLRTSVHVHINCMNDKMSTIYNFITLSAIFDELLVSQNGEHRAGNNFCLRAKDAEGMIIGLAECIRNSGYLSNVQQQNRYSSINIMSLFKFGTIEFRSMECTINRARLMHWVKTLLAIKEAARNFKNPAEIMGQFSQQGPERFFLSVLGPQALNYMRVVDRHRMLFEGLRLVQEFANAATWEPSTKGYAKFRVSKGSNMEAYPGQLQTFVPVPVAPVQYIWTANGPAPVQQPAAVVEAVESEPDTMDEDDF